MSAIRFRPLLAVLLLWLLGTGPALAQAGDGSQRDGYRYFEIGNVAAARPQPTSAGLLMVGGGDWPYDAFRWFIAKAGHGRIVVLRASGTVESQDEFFKEIGGVSAVQTIVFEDRKAASDPQVLAIVRNADGIFLAGGDQSNYVRMWKGTPLNQLLDAHVRAGKPLGGTSAGLAIQGAYSYGAMDGGSIDSPTALANPLGKGVTLVDDFLHLPHLQHVITDSHFNARQRQGRLIAFMARVAQEHPASAPLFGLGIDEYTALCVDADGVGKVYSGNGGHVWLFRAARQASPLQAGKPLTASDIDVTGLDTGSTLRLQDMAVERAGFERRYQVQAGELGESPR
jgi:cyanophycinase